MYMLRIILLAAFFLLSACAEEDLPEDTITTPTDVPVTSSNGDMNKYLGKWISSCGNSITNSSFGVILVYDITAVTTANSVDGMVEERVYNNNQCTGSPDIILSPQPYAVSLTYVGTSLVDNESLNSRFVGNADELLIQYASNPAVTRYLGFMDADSEFILKTSVNFSVFDLVYSKL